MGSSLIVHIIKLSVQSETWRMKLLFTLSRRIICAAIKSVSIGRRGEAALSRSLFSQGIKAKLLGRNYSSFVRASDCSSG